MKIMYIDIALDGHHKAYISALLSEKNSFIVLPERMRELPAECQKLYSSVDLNRKNFFSFMKWMRELSTIASKEKPDIVHFLTGDVFYKFFGAGLSFFRNYRTIITLHWVRPGILKQLSLRTFAHYVNKVVVHSEYLCKLLHSNGIHNAEYIEYPQFKEKTEIKHEEALRYWGLKGDRPVIVALGNTRIDKGLDILLEALKSVSLPYQLLIAGKAESFNETFIKDNTSSFSDSVVSALRYLTDEEVELAIEAADIVALPYRKAFNGASGPLGEGVCREKCIIGSDHGNLGYTIREHCLGYTFQTEKEKDLARVLNVALKEKWKVNDAYLLYKKELDPLRFVHRYQKIYSEI